MRVVVQVVLSFSLLVAFTTSAAAALCLQMEHPGPALMVGSMSTMDTPAQVPGAAQVSEPTHLSGLTSAPACCHQQHSTPQAITTSTRGLPDDQTAALPAWVGQVFEDNGHPPPGLFDPALEKRDHLAPSLISLSISRT